MFKVSDNKILYRVIKNTLYEMGELTQKELINDYPIPDDKLDKILHLDFDKCGDFELPKVSLGQIMNKEDFGLIDLRGIGVLKNLEKVTLTGIGRFEANNRAIGLAEKDLSSVDLKVMARRVKDITPLYGCKKIKELNLRRQSTIKEIDLSNFPNLNKVNMSNCDNLEKVVGLDKVVKGKDYSSLHFNFKDCESLVEIDNFETFVEQVKDVKSPIIELPLRSYCFLVHSKNFDTKERKERFNTLLNRSNISKWCEVGLSSDKNTSFSSAEMFSLMGKIDNIIINSCTSDDKTTMSKIHLCYDYVTDNINPYYENGINDSDRINGSEKLNVRTANGTLERGAGVCAGVCNLFALMVADLGVLCKSVYCTAGCGLGRTTVTAPNHQTCYIKLGKLGDFFFDPMWDTKVVREKDKNRIKKVYCGIEYYKFLRNHKFLYMSSYSSLKPTYTNELVAGFESSVVQSCSNRNNEFNKIIQEKQQIPKIIEDEQEPEYVGDRQTIICGANEYRC